MFYIYDVDQAATIKKVYELEKIDATHWENIQMAFLSNSYYVNPENYENAYDEHYTRFDNYFKYALESGALNTSTREELAHSLYLKVIKELFDPEYFEKRLEYHKNNNDKECLFEYMQKLDIAQLKEFLPTLLGSVFIFSWSKKEVASVWELLNRECLKMDPTAHTTSNIYDSNGYFNKELPLYFFDHLSKETIIQIIGNNICKENKYAAATLARIMYLEGIDAVKETESIWWCDC